ncbi:MAG: ATP synthase F1 subunit epsilon [bacterium]
MEGSRPITLRIITPEKVIYDEAVNHVVLPGVEGEAGIFHHHAPFMTYLVPGSLQIHLENRRIIHMKITNGLVEFKDNLLTLLTTKEISQDEISVTAVEENLQEEEMPAAGAGIDKEQKTEA